MFVRVKFCRGALICDVGAYRVLKDSSRASFPFCAVPRNSNTCSTLESEGFFCFVIVRVEVFGRFSTRYCILSHCAGS